jgi:fructose 1,6-bisphosphate aldolase/phosphatase
MWMNSSVSFFGGLPVVCALGFCVHNGKLTEAADAFDHPYWDYVRANVSRKASEIRQQGFSGAAMLLYSELEYGGIVKKMDNLGPGFRVRR